MKKVLYEELCPKEFEERIEECPVAYLPLGTLEWHGPHLPLGADGIQPRGLFIRVAKKVGGIVLPTLFLGPDRFYHDPEREFYGMDIYTGGTIVPYEMQQLTGSAYWMPDEQYQNMLRRIAANLARAGFRALVAHGHGPSTWQFAALKAEFQENWHLDCYTAYDFLEDDILGYQCDHASANETAIVMALCPELVQMDRIISGGEAPVGMAGRDPREFATKEYGMQVLEANVKAMSEGLRKYRSKGK